MTYRSPVHTWFALALLIGFPAIVIGHWAGLW